MGKGGRAGKGGEGRGGDEGETARVSENKLDTLCQLRLACRLFYFGTPGLEDIANSPAY